MKVGQKVLVDGKNGTILAYYPGDDSYEDDSYLVLLENGHTVDVIATLCYQRETNNENNKI